MHNICFQVLNEADKVKKWLEEKEAQQKMYVEFLFCCNIFTSEECFVLSRVVHVFITEALSFHWLTIKTFLI